MQKFQIAIYKWSKELADVYTVDFAMLKTSVNTIFLDKIMHLIQAIKKKISANKYI